IATVKVTEMVLLATGVVASDGVVLATAGTATQVPAPSQSVPPSWLHADPKVVGVNTVEPLLHESVVHWLLSLGVSVSSTALVVTLPAPSHLSERQSPAVGFATTVPE